MIVIRQLKIGLIPKIHLEQNWAGDWQKWGCECIPKWLCGVEILHAYFQSLKQFIFQSLQHDLARKLRECFSTSAISFLYEISYLFTLFYLLLIFITFKVLSCSCAPACVCILLSPLHSIMQFTLENLAHFMSKIVWFIM